MKVGEKIKNARIGRNMTQKEAASALGISQQAYSQYESGKRRPKPETLSKIAQALGVSIGDLGAGIDISALRGPTREQVAALKGKWKKINHWQYGELSFDTLECSKCEYEGEFDPEDNRPRFCPNCGSPMTDKAVDIVMQRLETLND